VFVKILPWHGKGRIYLVHSNTDTQVLIVTNEPFRLFSHYKLFTKSYLILRFCHVHIYEKYFFYDKHMTISLVSVPGTANTI